MPRQAFVDHFETNKRLHSVAMPPHHQQPN
jgi:hypothetical protein